MKKMRNYERINKESIDVTKCDTFFNNFELKLPNSNIF